MYRWGYWLTIGVLTGLISGYTIVGLTVPHYNKEFRNPVETGEFLYPELWGGKPDILDEPPWEEYDGLHNETASVWKQVYSSYRNKTQSEKFYSIVIILWPDFDDDVIEVLVDNASDEERAYVVDYINSFGNTSIRFYESLVSREYLTKYFRYVQNLDYLLFFHSTLIQSDGRIVVMVEPVNRGTVNKVLQELEGLVPPGLLVFRQSIWN